MFKPENYRCGTCVLEVCAKDANTTYEVTALSIPPLPIEPQHCICGGEVQFWIVPKKK